MQRRLGAALMGPASAAPPCAAIGKNMVNAKTFLEKRYSEDMELEDAIHTALLTLKEGFEGESGRGRAGWGRVRGHPRSSWLCACLGDLEWVKGLTAGVSCRAAGAPARPRKQEQLQGVCPLTPLVPPLPKF